jgi:putative membrane protein
VRFSQGPVQRALRLASVHVDTAGHRWQADAHCCDADEAGAMLERVAELARHARRRVSSGQV